MIRRPSDVWPRPLLDEFRRLARLPGLPVEFRLPDDGNPDSDQFICRPTVQLRFAYAYTSGQDFAGLVPATRWLAEGPKIADVTEDQFQALARVELRLELKDFHPPYPTVLVNMPPGKMHEYVLVHVEDHTGTGHILIASSCSPEHLHDVVTVIRQHGGDPIEKSTAMYSGAVTKEEGEATHACLRVAINMLLAMTHYGSHSEYLFPKEVEQERKYVAKGDRAGRDGRRASDRLAEQPTLLTLDREVVLHRTEKRGTSDGEPTGRQMPFHWRRGHWRKLNAGTNDDDDNNNATAPKLIFVRPCMVRADLLTVGAEETTTTYRV